MFKIGAKLRAIRSLRGENQDEFAAHFNLTRQTYGPYENDKREVDRELLYKMSKALNISEQDLIGDVPADKLTSVTKPDEATVNPREFLLQAQLIDTLKEALSLSRKENERQEIEIDELKKQIVRQHAQKRRDGE